MPHFTLNKTVAGLASAILAVVLICDTCSADTLLLSHWDSTQDADYSVGSATATACSGDTLPPLKTTQPKFGAKSLYLTGTNTQSIYYAAADNYNAAKGTVEFFYRPNDLAFDSNYYFAASIGGGIGSWYVYGQKIDNEGTREDYIRFVQREDNGEGGTDLTGYVSSVAGEYYSTDVWYHFAFTWDFTKPAGQREVAIFLNGNRIAFSDTLSCNPITGESSIAIDSTTTGALSITGYLDELRISDTVQYSGTTYTVPTEAFVVPEPATVSLVGLGGLLALVKGHGRH